MTTKLSFIKVFVPFLFFMIVNFSYSQEDCREILISAKDHLNSGNLKSALTDLQLTEVCDYKNILLTERQEFQNAIFSALEKQKVEAVANLKRFKSEKRAKLECEELKTELESSKKELEESNKQNELRAKINEEFFEWEEATNEVEKLSFDLLDALKDKAKVNDSIISYYQELCESDSDNYKSWLKYFYISTKANRGERDKLELLDKILELKSDFTIIYDKKGEIHYNMRELDSAMFNYDVAIELNPTYHKAYSHRANVLYERKEIEEAMLNYDKAIALNPEYGVAHYNKGLLYSEEEDYENALLNYDKAIALNPRKKDNYIAKGRVYENMKDYKKAEETYNKILDIDPNDKNVYFSIGGAKYANSEYESAIECYKKYIEYDSNSSAAYYNLGLSFHNLKSYDTALKNFDKSIDINPENIDAFIQKAKTYKALKEYANAIANLEKALLINPENIRANRDKGLNHYELKQYKKTIVHLNYAILKDPKGTLGYTKSILSDAITNLLEETNKEPYSSQELSFYPGYKMEKYKNIIDTENDTFSFSIANDSINYRTILNGTSPPIHKMNSTFPIQLNTQNVGAYLEFFCKNVHGEYGAFKILNSKQDLKWIEGTDLSIIQNESDKIDEFLEESNLAIISEEDYWLTERIVQYSHALFRAEFKIFKSGMVEMLDDLPVAANLPIKCFTYNGSFYEYEDSVIEED